MRARGPESQCVQVCCKHVFRCQSNALECLFPFQSLYYLKSLYSLVSHDMTLSNCSGFLAYVKMFQACLLYECSSLVCSPGGIIMLVIIFHWKWHSMCSWRESLTKKTMKLLNQASGQPALDMPRQLPVLFSHPYQEKEVGPMAGPRFRSTVNLDLRPLCQMLVSDPLSNLVVAICLHWSLE